MPITTWRIITISVSTRNVPPFVWRAFISVAWIFWGFFLPLRQSWPSNLVRERTIVLFVCEFHHCFQWLIHDWNYMSLLSNIVQLLSTDSILPLPSQRELSFLFDCWSLLLSQQLRSGLWNFELSSFDQYEVLQMSSILNNSVVHCFEQFLGRTKPRESEADQNPAILTWKNPPGSHRNAFRSPIIELGPIERRNLGRRHSVSVYWTNLRVLVLLHKLRLHENARRSCKQFVSLVRIGRIFQHVAQTSIQRNNFGFCRTVKRWRLFLAHPTNGAELDFRKYIRFLPRLILSPQGRQQNLSLGRQCWAVLPTIMISFGLRSRWVHPKYTWSRNEVGSSRSTFCISFFHMGTIFCFFPPLHVIHKHR